MPCRDGGPDQSEYNEYSASIVQKKLDDVTRMLCGVCKVLDLKVDNIGIISFDSDYTNTELSKAMTKIKGFAKWLKEHQEFDKARLAKAKQSALAKLTDDEKEALGL